MKDFYRNAQRLLKAFSLLGLLCTTFYLQASAQIISPSAVHIIGDSIVCENSQVSYSVSSSFVSYSWGVTGGTGVASGSSFMVQWGAAGSGVVAVTVIDLNGNISSLTKNVTITANPVAAISFIPPQTCPTIGQHNGSTKGGGCLKVCDSSILNFTTPNVAGNTYQWSVGGNGTAISASTNTSFNVQWGPVGNASVSLVVTNSAGCKDSSSVCFEVISKPIASFTTANVCFGIAAIFNNASSGATSYSWNFGDPGSGASNTSTLTNPTHVFSAAGTFNISLIAENDCHCADTVSASITVDATPGPQIVCPATVCQGDTAKYSTTASCSTYTWTVSPNGTIIAGAGTNAITVIWNTGPTGTVSLQVGGCNPTSFCTSPTVINIPIIPPTLTIAGNTTPCENSTECYSIPFFDGTITSWSISPSVSFTIKACNEICINWPFSGGSYVITVTYNNSFLNCSGTATLPVHVLPSLNISAPQKGCSAGTTTFNASASGIGAVNSSWSISPAGPYMSTGNGTSSFVVNWNGATGFYTVTATVASGIVCDSTVSVVIQVVPSPPKPTITGPTIVCPNSAQSYIASTGTDLTWSVTNGTLSSTSGNPVNVIWGASGPYGISVYQTDPQTTCQSDTSALTVHSFLPLAAPNFSVGLGTACNEGTSTFTNTTIYPAGVTLTWSLSPVNDGSVISGQGTNTVTIEWANVPNAMVTIKLTASVCTSSVSFANTVKILPPPPVSITPTGTFCPGNTITLTATSCGCTYLWSTGQTSNPIAVNTAGMYSVTLTNSNTHCSATANYNLVYNPAPSAIVNPTTINVCKGSPINATFYAQSGVGWTFLWNPGGVTTSSFTAHDTGTYMLTVTNSYGCKATTFVTVTNSICDTGCHPNLKYSVSFNSSQSSPNCSKVTFKNTSTAGSTNPHWNFGDGHDTVGNVVTHTYTIAGIYPVTLCVDVPNLSPPPSKCTICKTNNITIPVVAAFTANVCGIQATFTNTTTFAAGITGTYLWKFGDGNTSTLTNPPPHTYILPGNYTVTLTVTTSLGCTSTATMIVMIPSLTATFNPPKGCVGNALLFMAPVNTGSVTYLWNFGDLITSTLMNPHHTYAAAGSFPVTLTVTDACGNKATSSQKVTVSNACCNGILTANPNTPVCPGNNITLTAPACGSTYFWSNGAVTTTNTLAVNQTGTYSVIIKDLNNCTCNIPPINVLVNPAPLAVIIGDPEMCTLNCDFLATTFSPKYVYTWKDGNGTIVSTTSGFNFCPMSTAGTYSFTVAITDTSTHCSAMSLPFTVVVHPSPTVSISASGPTTFCSGGSVILTANPATGLTYSWNTGDNTPSILAQANGNYTVTVTDVNGCTATASMFVTVNPLPNLCGFQCGCYTKCSPYTIQGPPGGTTYQWLDNGSIIPMATNQNYTATVSGDYSVALSNTFGCMDTTCDLDLTLTSCNPVCAQLIADSVYCDSTGNIHLSYQVYNGSGFTTTGWSLHLIPPSSSILVMNDTAIVSLNSGDTSAVHDAEILGGIPGQRLCFVVGIYRLDQYGNSLFCCQSDSLCFNVPDCPTNCASLVIDDITCGASGYSINYQVHNLSSNDINEWIVSVYPPVTGVSVSSNVVSAPLAAGATSAVQTLVLTGASVGQQLCLAVSLHDLDQYGYCLFCCTSSEKTCFVVPSCSSQLDIHPNPSNQNITIETKVAGSAKFVRIFDLSGKLILNIPVTKNMIQLSVKNLSAGSYIVQMIGDNLIAQGKFIKQ